MERYVVKLIVPVLRLKVALLEGVLGLVKLVLHWVLGRRNGEIFVDLGNVVRRKLRRRKVLYLRYMLGWWNLDWMSEWRWHLLIR